jgi:hypothetical protein
MTCRHGPNDLNCSHHPSNLQARQYELENESEEKKRRKTVNDLQSKIRQLESMVQTSPDSQNYEVLTVHEVGTFLVLRVRYPNCAKCAYEGTKVMVYSGISLKDAFFWRTIDPHFRGPLQGAIKKVAPSPCARFPGDETGWKDAIAFATMKRGPGA